MSNPHKHKGDVYECALRNHIAEAGFEVSRTRAGYERDHGDIHVLGDGHGPTVIFQAKNNVSRVRLGEWLAATALQREQAGARHGVLVFKRQGVRAPGRQYAILELDDLLALLREAGYGGGVHDGTTRTS